MAETIQNESTMVLPPRLSEEARKKIRSQAMRHFRREQRKQRGDADERNKTRTLLPAPLEATDADNNEEGDRNAGENEDLGLIQEVALVNLPSSHSNDTDWQHHDIRIIPNPAGAAFHRYLLAEKFGAHLLGSEPAHPRSKGIIHYRGYVTTAQSDLVKSADDALCLSLPGCALKDSTILTECRKRHLAAVQNMRKGLEEGSYDIDNALAFAMSVIFVDIFEPFSIGFRGLYEGAVHLVRAHSEYFMSSEKPATRFLLIQFRHVVLLHCLSIRSPIPPGIEACNNLPWVSDLCSVMHETLMQLAIQVPDVLSTAREVRSCLATNSRIFTQAFGDLLKLERQLTQWQLEHCGGMRGHKGSDLAQSSAVPLLPVENGEAKQTVFLTAHAQAMCCICLLLLQESLADLLALKEDSFSKNEFFRRASSTADALCHVAEYFIQQGEGLIHKALSIRAPLHFARQWYAANGNSKSITWIYEKEAQVKKEAPFLSWEALLPLSLVCFYMHA